MVSKVMKLENPDGFHMRPAVTFTSALTKFDSDVALVFKGQRINGKSLLNIVASGISSGDVFTVECDGKDEKEALACAEKLIGSGFHV